MSVIPLTIFFSLLLAGTFVLLFAREQRRRRHGSAERDSLLPLAEETPREVAPGPGPSPARSPAPRFLRGADHGPAAADGTCRCHAGGRPPCADCLRRRDELEPAYF